MNNRVKDPPQKEETSNKTALGKAPDDISVPNEIKKEIKTVAQKSICSSR